MIKKLFAITALATLAVFAVPAAASAVTYVPSDGPSPKVTRVVVPPDEGYVGSKPAYVGYIGLASTGYDASVLAISGGSAALLLGLTLVTTSVVRRKRAEGSVRP
ncbi:MULTISPECIES: hypothetical protein [unclassified Cryobacterium]|uniref:hypothetical protein n=1 Tax=unclassified Cryobacterium TaxID=2649013 RepID=UPI00106C4B23|nr:MULTISPECIES: hypothetical protein [unclassified Cryobacterium]TFD05094.1 hypothetical protein E3T29_13695 [Cryobacterium sp. TMT1-66-1]TFD09757.1 hypothetical protein E3T35_14920 [Cryobacterium sp. TMT1-2-2]